MIEITASIEIVGADSNLIESISSDLVGNNISSDINDIKGKQQVGNNPFILGLSKLGGGATFSSKVDYFISGVVPTTEKPITITINASEPLSGVNLVFDTYNNAYPTSVIINGLNYENNSAKFTAVFYEAETINITINSWNKQDFPFKMQGIYLGDSIEINKRNLLSFERPLFDRADYKLPSYGIISNSGNISFNDIGNKVVKYAESNALTSDLSVKVFIENTLYGAKQQIADLKTEKWTPPSSSDKRYSVTLKDDLQEWQEINIENLNYDARYSKRENFLYIFNWLKSKTPERFKFADLDTKTQEYLENAFIEYPLLDNGALWQCWDKFCQATQCHIYKQNGLVYCKYNGGN